MSSEKNIASFIGVFGNPRHSLMMLEVAQLED